MTRPKINTKPQPPKPRYLLVYMDEHKDLLCILEAKDRHQVQIYNQEYQTIELFMNKTEAEEKANELAAKTGAIIVQNPDPQKTYLLLRVNSIKYHGRGNLLTTTEAIQSILDQQTPPKSMYQFIESCKKNKQAANPITDQLDPQYVLGLTNGDGIRRLKFYTGDTRIDPLVHWPPNQQNNTTTALKESE